MKLTTFGSDEEEGDELLKFYRASSTHPNAFIGYTDEGHEGTFTTVQGEKLQITLYFHTRLLGTKSTKYTSKYTYSHNIQL